MEQNKIKVTDKVKVTETQKQEMFSITRKVVELIKQKHL